MHGRRLIILQSGILIAGVLLVSYLIYQHFTSYKTLKGYYTVGVILNNLELTASDMEVTKLVIKKRLEQINRDGGVNGRELRALYLDDKGSAQEAQNVVKTNHAG